MGMCSWGGSGLALGMWRWLWKIGSIIPPITTCKVILPCSDGRTGSRQVAVRNSIFKNSNLGWFRVFCSCMVPWAPAWFPCRVTLWHLVVIVLLTTQRQSHQHPHSDALWTAEAPVPKWFFFSMPRPSPSVQTQHRNGVFSRLWMQDGAVRCLCDQHRNSVFMRK